MSIEKVLEIFVLLHSNISLFLKAAMCEVVEIDKVDIIWMMKVLNLG